MLLEICFKGLKNIPKHHVPSSIILSVSKGGSVKEELVLDYCRRVLRARGLFLCNEETLLLLDIHASHTHESVKRELDSMKIKYKYIPAKTTSYLQPLDVSVNGPCKAAMQYEWNKQYETGQQEFTPKGYRKRPSNEQILQMVSNGLKAIKTEVIKNSFEVCGIAPHGKKYLCSI